MRGHHARPSSNGKSSTLRGVSCWLSTRRARRNSASATFCKAFRAAGVVGERNAELGGQLRDQRHVEERREVDLVRPQDVGQHDLVLVRVQLRCLNL